MTTLMFDAAAMPASRLWRAAAPWCAAVMLTLGASAGSAMAATATAAVTVATVRVQAASSGAGLTLDGHIEAIRQATVAAQVAGNVLALTVKAGDPVRAGQVLARIDARSASAALAQGDAAVSQAAAGLQQARSNLDRSRELQRQGYVSQAALDNADNQYKAAEAAWQQAQAGRSQAVLARGFTSVVAPFDGWVLATHVDTGDLASPGRPLVSVYAPQGLRAVVQLPASLTDRALTAQRIEVRRPDGRWITPTRHAVLPSADAVSQTVEWRLDLAAADGLGLRPGQAVQVRFLGAAPAGPAATGAGASPALSLPATALLRRGELTAVYVAQGNAFVLRAVRVGPEVGHNGEARVPVLAGLKAGEDVAVDAVRAGLAQARPAGGAR